VAEGDGVAVNEGAPGQGPPRAQLSTCQPAARAKPGNISAGSKRRRRNGMADKRLVPAVEKKRVFEKKRRILPPDRFAKEQEWRKIYS